MSFIQTNYNPVIIARTHIKISAGASGSVEKRLKGTARIVFSARGNATNAVQGSGMCAINLTAAGFGRLNNEANIFGSGSSSINFSASATPQTVKNFSATARIALTAHAGSTLQKANRGDALFNVQIVPVSGVSNYQKFKTRFSANGTEIKIRSFRLEYPAKSVGSKLSVDLANPVRNQFDQNTSFKFEYNLGLGWRTILDTAKLDAESISSRFFDDRVNLDISAPLSDKFALSPRRTKIYYDGTKTSVETEEFDVLKDTFGNSFPISAQNVGNLSLYYLLNKAFVAGCGFASVIMNIPDYRIVRADFSTGQTFKDSVGGFIGMFEPVFFEDNNILYILDTSNVLPSGFTPRTISASKFTNFSSNAQKRTILDGFDVSFADSEGEYYTQRQTQKTEPSGTFGNSDYSETDVLTTIREYRNFDNPGVILRTEIKDQQRIIYDSVFNQIGQETLTRNFNSSGRLTSIVKQNLARVPDLNNSGNLLLQNLREEETRLFYKPNPKNTREILTNRVEKRISGLIAIDSENPYFNEPFEQEYLKAHENGNLNENMTSRFGAIRTIIETFETDGRGQTDIRREVIDHIRGVSVEPETDTRGGLNSFSQYQQPNTVRVWRTGANRTSDKGGAFAGLSAGELPNRLAIALANRKLAKQTANNQTGTFDLIGSDPSLRRGSSVRILDRWNASFGNFLIEGLTIQGDNKSLSTSIQATEIS
jgi:hypothetical protein